MQPLITGLHFHPTLYWLPPPFSLSRSPCSREDIIAGLRNYSKAQTAKRLGAMAGGVREGGVAKPARGAAARQRRLTINTGRGPGGAAGGLEAMGECGGLLGVAGVSIWVSCQVFGCDPLLGVSLVHSPLTPSLLAATCADDTPAGSPTSPAPARSEGAPGLRPCGGKVLPTGRQLSPPLAGPTTPHSRPRDLPAPFTPPARLIAGASRCLSLRFQGSLIHNPRATTINPAAAATMGCGVAGEGACISPRASVVLDYGAPCGGLSPFALHFHQQYSHADSMAAEGGHSGGQGDPATDEVGEDGCAAEEVAAAAQGAPPSAGGSGEEGQLDALDLDAVLSQLVEEPVSGVACRAGWLAGCRVGGGRHSRCRCVSGAMWPLPFELVALSNSPDCILLPSDRHIQYAAVADPQCQRRGLPVRADAL